MPPKPPPPPTTPSTTKPPSSSSSSKNPGKSAKAEVASIDELALPRSIVTRLAKSVLPPKAMIQKAALESLSQGGTVFVNFLSSTANEVARKEGRKGINANDVINALKHCEFEDFVPRVERELELFAAGENKKKEEKGKGKEEGESTPVKAAEGEDTGTPIAKKARVSAVGAAITPEPSAPMQNNHDDESEDDVEDATASDDEAVVSNDEVGEEATFADELEKGLDNGSGPEEGGREEEEDDALDDGTISD